MLPFLICQTFCYISNSLKIIQYWVLWLFQKLPKFPHLVTLDQQSQKLASTWKTGFSEIMRKNSNKAKKKKKRKMRKKSEVIFLVVKSWQVVVRSSYCCNNEEENKRGSSAAATTDPAATRTRSYKENFSVDLHFARIWAFSLAYKSLVTIFSQSEA